MIQLSQSDCLALWETGRTLHPIDQGILAVETAFPETRTEGVADWPLGRRNRALAEIYSGHFQRMLTGWTECRECNEKLEFSVDCESLLQGEAADPSAVVLIEGQRFRVPNSRDLAAIANEADSDYAAIELLRRCCVDGRPDALDEAQREKVGEQLAKVDPLSEIQLRFDCPTCAAAFEEGLELAQFLWKALEAAAQRLLTEVHILACAYGWSESEILSLTSVRREFYLRMVGA